MTYPPAGYPREPELAKELTGESVAKAYARLSTNRYHYINRAHDNSALTIPAIMRPSQYTSTTGLDTPWQSTGARGVNNLASKLVLGLFPPGLSFFVLDVNPYLLAAVAEAEGREVEGLKSDVEQSVSVIERQVSRQIETASMRATLYEAFQHLEVTGNGVLYVKDDLSIRFYNLKEYVVLRDTSGNLMRLITVDRLSKEMLPEGQRAAARDNEDGQTLVYTDVVRIDKDTFKISQEVETKEGESAPAQSGESEVGSDRVPEDKLPFIVLRFQQLSGESYGRAHVEDLLGDLAALEGLRQAIVEAAAAAAKLLWLVNPNGITRATDLSDADNGAFVPGKREDVEALVLEKLHDLAFAASQAAEIKKDLEAAFLMGAAFRRDAERVTAEEIRMIQQELEGALGGVYSLLAQSLQMPLVRRMISVMERKNEIPTLPKGILEPQIITGVEGLGRGADFQNTMAASNALAALIGPEEFALQVEPNELAKRIYTGAGVDAHSLLRKKEDVDELRTARQKSAAIESVGPQLVKEGANLLQNTGTES